MSRKQASPTVPPASVSILALKGPMRGDRRYFGLHGPSYPCISAETASKEQGRVSRVSCCRCKHLSVNNWVRSGASWLHQCLWRKPSAASAKIAPALGTPTWQSVGGIATHVDIPELGSSQMKASSSIRRREAAAAWAVDA